VCKPLSFQRDGVIMNKCAKGLAVLMILVVASVSHAQSHGCALSDLSWMAGLWHNASDPERAQERWALAPNGVLMGSSWEFPPGKSGFAEIMTVRPNGDSISMFLRHFDGGLKSAWEERGAPMVFTASHCERDNALFDGQEDHAGEHMSYRRSGKKLTIVADFLHHGTPDHEEWHMIRVGN
jgi:hypothetical protein